jgi:large subunit ribosomal protein L10e
MSQKSENDNFITGAPAPKISIFENGEKHAEFPDEKRVYLSVEEDAAIRGNALEAARVAANSHLRKELGPEYYHLKVKVYPHHVLRYHPLAGVAQADRYYEGMRKPFGRPTGRAALVDEDQEIIYVRVSGDDYQAAKKALRRARDKLPVTGRVKVSDADK